MNLGFGDWSWGFLRGGGGGIWDAIWGQFGGIWGLGDEFGARCEIFGEGLVESWGERGVWVMNLAFGVLGGGVLGMVWGQ